MWLRLDPVLGPGKAKNGLSKAHLWCGVASLKAFFRGCSEIRQQPWVAPDGDDVFAGFGLRRE